MKDRPDTEIEALIRAMNLRRAPLWQRVWWKLRALAGGE